MVNQKYGLVRVGMYGYHGFLSSCLTFASQACQKNPYSLASHENGEGAG